MRKGFRAVAAVLLLSFIGGVSGCLTGGKVSKKDLMMTRPEWAPDVPALLLDHAVEGYIARTAAGFEMRVNKRMKIKLFEEQALEYADVELYIPGAEKVKQFEARTIRPDGSTVKVDKGDLFDQVVYSGPANDRRHRLYQFAFPQATVGSILELEYSYVTENIYLFPPFYFDSYNLPSVKSTVSLTVPFTLQYRTGLVNVIDWTGRLSTSTHLIAAPHSTRSHGISPARRCSLSTPRTRDSSGCRTGSSRMS
ncbi:MAG: hypothetical protein MAG453_01578 [Calditrichaeota bacterium]|nr:hypothetical protein [Calditrichota bacterium]